MRRDDGLRRVLPKADFPRLFRFIEFWQQVRIPLSPRFSRIVGTLEALTRPPDFTATPDEFLAPALGLAS